MAIAFFLALRALALSLRLGPGNPVDDPVPRGYIAFMNRNLNLLLTNALLNGAAVGF